MGFAHLLILLGIPYDSPGAARTGEEIMKFIHAESKIASNRLAQLRGAFPNYKGSIWEKKGLLQRNATTTTIAPTGTLSILGGTSSGIEPIYDIQYSRVLFGDIEVEVVDPLYQDIKSTKDERERLQTLFRRAHQVSPEAHLRIQAAFQTHVDNAVSKTVNLPREATVSDVIHIYSDAYRMGLKGVTVFRDKSRDAQVLSCGAHQVC
jgi:ribonucleoside-diphosphate reductase alpha chain